MPTDPVGVTDSSPGTGIALINTVEVPSPDSSTTTTADPGTGGTTLAITSAARFPSTNNYKVKVDSEIMLVTAGAGTTSWTVTRGQDGTTGAAHSVGATVYLVVNTQRVSPIDERVITFKGRAMTFNTPGRAGTAGQKIFAIHNATGSNVKVRVNKVIVDIAVTVIKAVTVLPPVIRLWKFTAVPTNGTAGTKVPTDSALSSSSSVTVWQDASANGTSSATALTITLPAATVYTQEWAPRLITAAGYEMFDREVFLDGSDNYITLNALEGVAVFLDYTLATQNPVTDIWLAGCEWEEYTNP